MKAVKTCKTEYTKNHIFQKADKNTSVGLRAQSKLSMRRAVRKGRAEAGREQPLGEQSTEHGLPGHRAQGTDTSGLRDALGEASSTISDN